MKKISKAKDILINIHYMVCVHVWSLQGKHIGQMIIIENRLGANRLEEKK